LQRQPGAPVMPVRVQIRVPAGLTVRAYPRPDRLLGESAIFELIWNTDERIQVTLEQPALSFPIAIVGAIGLIALVMVGLYVRHRREQI
jgi:hypothetical protein